MLEVVYQLNDACERSHREEVLVGTSLSSIPFSQASSLCHLGQQLDLVVGGLGVMRCTFLHLHCYKAVEVHVLAQPHSRKVTPAKLGDNAIPAIVDLPDLNDVVSAFSVAVLTFIVTFSVFFGLSRLLHDKNA